jgi:hypothetical protein
MANTEYIVYQKERIERGRTGWRLYERIAYPSNLILKTGFSYACYTTVFTSHAH